KLELNMIVTSTNTKEGTIIVLIGSHVHALFIAILRDTWFQFDTLTSYIIIILLKALEKIDLKCYYIKKYFVQFMYRLLNINFITSKITFLQEREEILFIMFYSHALVVK
ncbi:hypothetical protein ACJX0J_020608, partial [Zea mays]